MLAKGYLLYDFFIDIPGFQAVIFNEPNDKRNQQLILNFWDVNRPFEVEKKVVSSNLSS
jgi:hypothetical protein